MDNILLRWTDLSYKIKDKTILVSQSGAISRGTLTAILGVSGSGKTTLLKVLSKQISDNITGDIWLADKQSKMAVVPQNDCLYEKFTVHETLSFAIRIKAKVSRLRMLVAASDILDKIDMSDKEKALVCDLSGGERKRLAIAVELVSVPKILLLDEFTTGLDSSTAMKIVSMIETYAAATQSAILASIHQPSNDILNTFDQVYLISPQGKKIYHDSPRNVLSYLDRRAIVYKKNRSIGDLILEHISGDTAQNQDCLSLDDKMRGLEEIKYRKMADIKYESYQAWLLFKRTFLANYVKRRFLIYSILINVAMCVISGYGIKTTIGSEDGCQLPAAKEVISMKEVRQVFHAKNVNVRDTVSYLFGNLLLLSIVTTVPASLSIPAEVAIISREVNNRWYAMNSYFVGKMASVIVEVVLQVTSYQLAFVFVHQWQGEYWRIISWYLIVVSNTLITALLGLIFGTIFRRNLNNAVIVTGFYLFPATYFSSFYVNINDASAIFKPLFRVNFYSNALTAVLSVNYGFGRCPDTNATKTFVDTISSLNSPRDTVSQVMNRHNFSWRYINILATVYNIPWGVASNVSNAMETFFNPPEPQIDEVIEKSAILEKYGIPDDGVNTYQDILSLVIWLTVLTFILKRLLSRVVS
ncbi:ATP-binding cassette sub-family G member 1 [Halotydeus destructor]|nr:ATP-binding cassette sub-family G member 1 [Halotydeus destructor]